MGILFLCMIFIMGVLLGMFLGVLIEYSRTNDLGTMTIDPGNVEEGLFSIQFSEDPMKVDDGKWIRFKMVRK